MSGYIQNNLREVMYKEEESSIKAEISPAKGKIPKTSIEHAYVTPVCTQISLPLRVWHTDWYFIKTRNHGQHTVPNKEPLFKKNLNQNACF